MCWALSYPAMSCSNLLWLKLDGSRALFSKKQTLAPLTGTSLALMTSHVFVSLVIVVGSAWCFFTIPHFDGRSDDCPAIIGSAPVCDSVVFYGELAYFVTWFLTFAYITVKHPPHTPGTAEKSTAEPRQPISPIKFSPLTMTGPVAFDPATGIFVNIEKIFAEAGTSAGESAAMETSKE